MILFLMFLAALNLIDRFYFCIYGAAAIFFLSPRRNLRVNGSVVALLVLSFSVILFNPASQTSIMNIIRPFTYVLCYLMGFGLVQRKHPAQVTLQQEEKVVSSVIYVLSAGTMVHFLLNMSANSGIEVRDEVIDFWTKDIMAATVQAALGCLTVAVSIAFLFSKVSKLKKVIAIVALTLIITYNLLLAGRTLFVFIILLSLVALIYLYFLNRKTMMKVLIIVLVLVLLLTILYNADAFGMKTSVETSNFYMRFYGGRETQDLNEDKRMDHKMAFLERMLDHPWGGSKINEDYGHHAHDLYLDTYDESSIFALIAIVCYIIASLVRWWRCIRSQKLSQEIRMLIFCTYLACNIEFWLEPILSGVPWLLACYCFMDGAVTYLLTKEKDFPALPQTTTAK